MEIYAKEPQRALQLIDSAEVVGNVSEFRAELLRSRVYAYPNDAMNLDTARQMGVALQEVAHDYAARYHAQEQKMEIQQLEAEANRNALVAIAAIFLALLAVGFAVYYFRQQRVMQKKNRVLVEQMTEAVEYKRMMEEERSKSGESDEAELVKIPDEIGDFNTLTTDELSQHIRSVILCERLYLNM